MVQIFKILWSLIDKVIRNIILLLAGFFHLKLEDTKLESILQFAKFSMIGVSNVIVSYLINISTLFLLRKAEIRVDYVIANLTAFALSVLWSFYWNGRLVFQQRQGKERNKWNTLFKTYLSYGFTGIILNNIMSSFWIYVVGISKYISPLLNLPISVPVNFLLNKLWVYGKSNSIRDGK